MCVRCFLRQCCRANKFIIENHGASFSRWGRWSRFQRRRASSLVSANRNFNVGNSTRSAGKLLAGLRWREAAFKFQQFVLQPERELFHVMPLVVRQQLNRQGKFAEFAADLGNLGLVLARGFGQRQQVGEIIQQRFLHGQAALSSARIFRVEALRRSISAWSFFIRRKMWRNSSSHLAMAVVMRPASLAVNLMSKDFCMTDDM